ncbi:MAG TPA: IF-2 protein, partial [Myxococcaceae bacterium]|nr:IF-2 protein [Myxococcaceae bacterium]
AFFQARTRLDQARRDIAEAVAQLRIAADSGGRHARAAHRMLGSVEAPATALEEALRRAVYTLDSDTADGSTPAVPTGPGSAPGSGTTAGRVTPDGGAR